MKAVEEQRRVRNQPTRDFCFYGSNKYRNGSHGNFFFFLRAAKVCSNLKKKNIGCSQEVHRLTNWDSFVHLKTLFHQLLNDMAYMHCVYKHLCVRSYFVKIGRNGLKMDKIGPIGSKFGFAWSQWISTGLNVSSHSVWLQIFHNCSLFVSCGSCGS